LHSFAESCRTQEVHHLQQQRLVTPDLTQETS